MNFGISLELALFILSLYPTFDEISTAKEWVASNLGETASFMPFSFKYGDAFSNESNIATDEEKAKDARELINQYLNIQKYFYGDYYTLTGYSTTRDVWIAWQLDRPEMGEGLIQAFRRENCSQELSMLILKGLEKDSKYILTDLDSSTSYMIAGEELMKTGLAVSIKQQPGSSMILYKKSTSRGKLPE